MSYPYGSIIFSIIGTACQPNDFCYEFAFGLYQAEVDYPVREEWARTAEDILTRRTKLGLYFDAAVTDQL